MIQVDSHVIEIFKGQKKELKGYTVRANELKKIYQTIVNLSKQLPSYIINLSKENQEYTIGVKEAALTLKSKVTDLLDENHPCYKSKVLSVSDETAVMAHLISEDISELPEMIELNINCLASEQINQSRDAHHFSKELAKGRYKFKLNILDETYHLEFVQKERESNLEVLQKVEQYLNENAPALRTIVEKGNSVETSRLVITSELMGNKDGKTFYFEDDASNQRNFVEFLDLNHIKKYPSNADFEINGGKKQTSVNNFTIEKAMHMTLLNPTSDPVTIRIHKDYEKILESLKGVLNEFNELICLATNRMEQEQETYRAKALVSELSHLARHHKNELRGCGIHMGELGILVLDETESKAAAEEGKIELLFRNENGFIYHVMNKAESIAINPFNYLDKKIVTYPGNEKKTYVNPYITSFYSGLFFSSYC